MARTRSKRGAAATERKAASGPPPPPLIDPQQAWIDGAKAAVAEREPGVSILAGRVLRKYSPLEQDRARLEVQTDKGFFEVILGRDGNMTIFQK